MSDQDKAEAWREANKAWASTVLIAGILAVAALIFATSGFTSQTQKEVAHVIVWLPGLWAAFQFLGFYRFPKQNLTNLLIIALCGVIFLLSGCSLPRDPKASPPGEDEEVKMQEENRIKTLINHCRDVIDRKGGRWPSSQPRTLSEVPCTMEEMRAERMRYETGYYQRHPDHKREVEQ